MKKIILYIATSLDGYIADIDGSVDWLFTDCDYGYSAFLKSIGTTVMGGETYRQVLGFGDFPYGDKRNIVITRQKDLKKEKGVEFFEGDIFELCETLKEKSDKDIWLVGGADIIAQLMSEGLVDELILSMQPTILGNGIRLFDGELPKAQLKLFSSQTFTSGMIQLRYGKKSAL